MNQILHPTCSLPITDYPTVQLAHGGGGTLMQQLLEKMILPAFKNKWSEPQHDSAVLDVGGARLAFTTDSYTITPLFFPGGDIGTLAVNGTVNDLAMSGAKPLYLSAGMIIEEGFPMQDLWRIVQSMKQAADEAGVQFVTGDTKVVDKGKADGIFINTAGIGVIEHDLIVSPQSVKPGDAILISGDIGRHGIAIMALREGLEFETTIESDCASVAAIALKLIAEDIDVHCMRDLTRGGLASALVEIAESASVHMDLDEQLIPVHEDVAAACEILGFDPLHVANEGRFLVIVSPSDVERALACLKTDILCEEATLIGEISDKPERLVTMKSRIGVNRIVDMLSGEQLPRIC